MSDHSTIPDVVIIGGGVIGCASALELARRGARVTLIERGALGCEASRAAAGLLTPQTEATGPGPLLDLALRSRAMFREWAAGIERLSGQKVEYRDEGMICVAFDSEEAARIDEWSGWQPEAGLAIQHVSARDILAMEPALSSEIIRGVLIPADHQVDNRLLMDALALAIRQTGVEVLEFTEARSIFVDGGGFGSLEHSGGRLRAKALLITAGCWSGGLLEPLGLALPTIPVRGQMIAVGVSPSLIAHTLHSGECYVVPRRDGRLLVGSTLEYAGFRKANTASGTIGLLSAGVRLVPELRNSEIEEVWSGLRPDTPDHLPVLGRSGIDNLFLATGHFRNGVLLAPVTAEIMADLIEVNREAELIGSFGWDRFGPTARQ